MEFIIQIKGNVKFKLTLDPTVWIFDDRKLDLSKYFTEERVKRDELEDYKRGMGEHWSREIMEGATVPPTLNSEKRYKKQEKQEMLTGTFGILFKPFIENAEPVDSAETVVFESSNGEYSFPLEAAKDLVLKFSQEGKPLREDGPVHILLPDGSNLDNPITNVTAIRVE
ncbi:peptidyl-prolyl cis-trans isomerase [Planococcus sp. X10-3]|uniref:peptidyl-prolyl cis-trans isomerase n=1 Tax=Planococcus sp. X10-3 TaxID=3061240 RepID=UPI003BB04327